MRVQDIDSITYYLSKVFGGQQDADELFRLLEVLKNERHKLEKKHVKK
jgi:hypothetical protein